jgi:chromate reductase, NAD(P)H dehydrogenase (quinone)
MNKKILAFGASNSKNSINKKLAVFASSQISDADVNLIDLNNFEMPIFSVDREMENGFPEQAQKLKEYIVNSDGVIISFAEHNGNFTAVFKNIFDWISRLDLNVWKNKPMLLMSTSPGKQGAKSVLKQAVNTFPYSGANVVANFSLPSFNTNFSENGGILDATLKVEFEDKLNQFTQIL